MISAYLTNLTLLDAFILLLGGAVAIVSVYGARTLGNHGANERPREHRERREHWLSTLRIASVITDILPLLGLLGTALAILDTFMNLGGGIQSTEIVAKFAPGLTTTVSGLSMAILNTVLIQTFFAPAFEKRFED